MKHRWGELMVLIPVIGVAAVWFWRPQSHHSEDDRFVDDCLKRYGKALEKRLNVVPDHQAANDALAAIRRMGEPAIKRLVDLVEAKDQGNKPTLDGWYWERFPAGDPSERIYSAYYHRRSIAIRILCELGPSASNAIPGLIRSFGTEYLGSDAARVLAALEAAAVGPLIAELRSTSIQNRVYAADALNRMGTNAAKALPALRTLMLDTNQIVRSAAIRAWGGIGYPDVEVQRELTEILLSDTNAIDAVWGLANLPQGGFPIFARALTSSNAATRFAGVVGLRTWLGTATGKNVDRDDFYPRGVPSGRDNPMLMSFWRSLSFCERMVKAGLNLNEWMVASAIKSLDSTGSWGEEISLEVRRTSAELLGAFPAYKARITPVLQRATRDADELVRIAAGRSLEKLTSASGVGGPELQ